MILDVTQSIHGSEKAADGSLRATLLFRASLEVFRGHFPTHPLVPGVYLLEAARQLTARLRADGRALRITAVRDARFTGEVLPDVEVEVTLTPRPPDQDTSYEAHFARGETELARIRFDTTPA